MPSIYLITGVMASGKSAVAEALAKRFKKGVHLHGDVFRGMIVSGRQDMTARHNPEAMRQLQLRYALAVQAAEVYHSAGFDVVWQDVIVGQVLSDVLARVTPRPLYVVVLCPDNATVDRREGHRDETGYDGGFTPESFDTLLHTETPHVGLWIDSAGLTPAETVDEIIGRTESGEGRID